MSDDLRSIKVDNKLRRWRFARNLRDLTSAVMRLNRQDAAESLGVDYGWFRKACSVGLSRPDKRSLPQLTKVAERFHLAVEDLWTPYLLVQIWEGSYRPDVRDYFIREFHFQQYAMNSKEFQQDVEECQECASGGLQLGTSEHKFTEPEDQPPHSEGQPAGADKKGNACEQLALLLATGKYEYLRDLINDLYAAEKG